MILTQGRQANQRRRRDSLAANLRTFARELILAPESFIEPKT
jgi:hypothetical protein